MVSTVLTLKTKVAPTIQIYSAGFSTSSTSYVDVTGAYSTISVPNGQQVCFRVQGRNGSNSTGWIQPYLGTIALTAQTVTSNVDAYVVFSATSNQSGGALTAKVQVKSTVSTSTFVDRIIFCYGSFASYSFNAKVQITSISFYELSDVSNAMMGNVSVGANEALTVSTVNAISTNGLNLQNLTGTCIFDWDGYYIGVTP